VAAVEPTSNPPKALDVMARVVRHIVMVALMLAASAPVGCQWRERGVGAASRQASDDYPWPRSNAAYDPLAARLPTPRGFRRVPLERGSWGDWLRHLPLLPRGSPVTSHRDDLVMPGDFPALAAVADLDVRKNQECADTILRLRAEYLRQAGRDREIVFKAANGEAISWGRWKGGMRPHSDGRRLWSTRDARPDASRASFDRFLDAVFTWCGTYSLAQEGTAASITDARVGDFFVHPGNPGHAVLIVDLARNDSGRTRALLLEGYMPAQSAHILARARGLPWFDLDPERPLYTPVWGGRFRATELRRFVDNSVSRTSR